MKLWRRLRYLLRSRENNELLAEELAFHQAMKQKKYEDEGLSTADARRAAAREMGNLTHVHEDSRQIWLWRGIEAVAQDVRYGFRTLLQNLGFTTIAVLALALGIGLNTMLFTVFNALVLAPWAVKDPATVVSVFRAPEKNARRANYSGFSMPAIEYLRQHTKTLSGIAATSNTGPTTLNDSAVVRGGYYVTGNYLSLLGADMAAGRGFLPEEDAPHNGKPVVVLSHRAWQQYFNGDRSVVGTNIKLNYSRFLVVGITAPAFTGSSATLPDFWIPMHAMHLLDPSRDWIANGRDFCCFDVAGRLAPGVSRKQASAELSVLLNQYAKDAHIEEDRAVFLARATFVSTPDREAVVYPILGLVAGAVLLVLLIACANIANLLLARATARQREIGIRLSIGASRFRVVRQLMTESLLLAIAGSVFAIALAGSVTGPLMRHFANEPLSFSFEPDYRVFAYTAVLAVLATLAFGLVPALHATRTSLNSALRADNFLGGRLTTSRLRNILLGAQVAFSLVLLVGAGLMTRALQHAQGVDPGFAVKNVAVLSVDLRLHSYDDAATAAFFRDLMGRIAVLPNVRSVAHAFVIPLGTMRASTAGEIDGRKEAGKNTTPVFQFNRVSFDYLRTLKIPIVKGRYFKPSDVHAVIVNEAMADRFWRGVNPVGHRIRSGKEEFDVIGVMKNVRSTNLSSTDDAYVYQLADGGADQRVVVRTDGDPRELIGVLPKLAAAVDPRVRGTVTLLGDNLEGQINRQRYVASIAGSLGGLALALACIGIYGVVGYTVQQRTREIGVRMALGATRQHVLSAILKQNFRVVGVGAIIGIAAAAGLSRLIAAFLYGVSPLDPVSFGAVLIALLASAMLASYLPARRAVSIDPFRALRHE
jgi:predicted permease